jgi:hypothetical protein
MPYRIAAAALLWPLLAAPARAQAAEPAPVVILGSRMPLAEGLRSTSQPDVARAVQEGAGQLEDLADQVPGMQPLVADGGLSGSISLRGFGVSRFYINGLRDVNRMFVRDLATVASVRLLRGPDALAAGFTSPGGTVWFEGLQPEWRSRQHIALGLGSGEGWRTTVDSTGPLALGGAGGGAGGGDSPLAWRALLQWQDGRSRPGDQHLGRHTALLALAWRNAALGRLTVEAEHQHNHQPYLFGTVISGERVRFDQLYASTAQQSRRVTGRQGLHWQQDWAWTDGDRLQLRADAGGAQVRRSETLIGFFSQRTSALLSGYYTQYHDAYLQHDARLWAQWHTTLAGLPHTLTWSWTRSAQRFVFEGVQNVGGFDVLVKAPTSVASMRRRWRCRRAFATRTRSNGPGRCTTPCACLAAGRCRPGLASWRTGPMPTARVWACGRPAGWRAALASSVWPGSGQVA